MQYLFWRSFLFAAFPLFATFDFLQGISLNDAEEIALQYNKRLLIAEEATLQSFERKLQAISRWLPSIFYYAAFQGTEQKEDFFNVFDPVNAFSPSNTGYSSIFQLDQPLFSTDLIFGLASETLEAQKYQYRQANTKNELLLAVRQSYYAAVSLEISLDIQRETIRYLSFALKQQQGQLDAGSSTPYEVNQNKVAVTNAISAYYATLKDLKNARNSLILTLGIDPLLEPKIRISERTIPLGSIPEIAVKLQQLETKYHYPGNTFPSTSDVLSHIDQIDQLRELSLFTETDVQDYIDLAVSLRPDLLAQKLQIDISEQHLKAKWGTYFPKIDGYARFSYNDNFLGPTPFGSEHYNWVGGITLSWNLFDSLLREHKIKEARSVRHSSQIGFDKELQKIEVEIRNGLYQLEESMLFYLSASQGAMVAEQARGQSADKLQFGRIPPLEYRDSVNLLATARNQKNRASFELIAAYYQLRYALGLDAGDGAFVSGRF